MAGGGVGDAAGVRVGGAVLTAVGAALCGGAAAVSDASRSGVGDGGWAVGRANTWQPLRATSNTTLATKTP